ncbi:LLM class flavin-dependent oxidoreductase [Pseudonocardia sp. TRM90224]|uniref:LLM class flavin-dependent oxidoreductase n=1 Tax=Pseudonocardia sp. TRM90224 TaxID=2812678 RepID=UPI001E60C7C0|nr:LLM class flavin-dependent oxidoreductase [Pseudonocardia sp. TRM90224]
MDERRLGVVFGSVTPPEGIGRMARRAEELGFGELWFSEDCFFSGGMSGIAQMLAATTRIPVGTGAVSVLSRHPAVTAMEFAGLARSFPGRVVPGVALGVVGWLEQMGVRSGRPLTVLRESVGQIRALLQGDEVTSDGVAHSLKSVRLDFPPPAPLPIHIGAVNERALRLSGEIADGTILSVLSGPRYVRWARERIAEGAARAGGDPARHRVTAFALYAVDPDGAQARAAVRETVAMFLAAEAASALVRVPGLAEPLSDLLADSAALAERIPDAWLDEVAVAGDPDHCRARLRALYDAGADSVGLWLFPTDRAEQVAELTAREVLPHVV